MLTRDEILDDEIRKNGIYLSKINNEVLKACSVKMELSKMIFYDVTKFESSAELYVAKVEELFHCQKDIFYGMRTSLLERGKKEYEITKEVVFNLLPLSVLYSLLKQKKEIWEISEELDLPVSLIEKSIQIYRNKGLLYNEYDEMD